jgi:hypothetical protein
MSEKPKTKSDPRPGLVREECDSTDAYLAILLKLIILPTNLNIPLSLVIVNTPFNCHQTLPKDNNSIVHNTRYHDNINIIIYIKYFKIRHIQMHNSQNTIICFFSCYFIII